MIQKLRRRFITVAMASTALVLFLIIAGINIANYININQSADEILAILVENDGTFPSMSSPEKKERPEEENEPPAEDRQPPDKKDRDHPRRRSSLGAEAAFNTRYFSVELDEDGTVYAIDTGNIFATSSDRAAEYATDLFAKNKTGGFIGHYKYTRMQKTEDNGTHYTYIFLDCEQDIRTFQNFLVASILISVSGLLVVFILVLIFSKQTLKPIAESYTKQKRFITDASHELKTPLTIIDANIEILEMMGEENEWTASIHNQVRRLTDLTQKMVFLSRMDEENTHMTMLDFSLSDAVTESVEPFLAVAQTRNRTLTMSVEPNISFHGDEASIRQVITLLLDNALKYSSEPGEIKVTLTANARSRKLTIWNTVDEIEPGSQDMLFDRFYRRDSSRSSQTGGHGIGLSVAQAIILAHRGRISAKSIDGKSIQFTITL